MEPYYYTRIGKASDLTDKKERFFYRLLEILPGLLSWATLFLVVYLSFTKPVGIAIFIIVFDIYWFIRTLYMTLYFKASFGQVRKNLKINWLEKLKELETPNRELGVNDWQEIYHLIILPTYKEGVEVISEALESLVRASYPREKMIVVLAQEERAGRDFNLEIFKEVEIKFGNIFFKFVSVEHPGNIMGELAGKGSNIAWAAKKVKDEIIDQLGLAYEKVIVSALDIDTIVFPEYFSRLTYVYLTTKNPLRASYQPIPFYTNNVWSAPAFARIVAFSSTFWYTILQERADVATTFSSHSMPLKALVDVNFWQTNIVSEDSRIYLQNLLNYDGGYRIQPLFYPITMDANVASTFWKTIINVYKQQRRWAWGVESVPYSIFGFWKNKTIPKAKKIWLAFIMMEGFWSWATNALVIFLLGWLPLTLGGNAFNATVLSFNLPYLTKIIMTFALIGLVTTAVFSMMILPPRPLGHGKMKYFFMAAQWIIFPIVTIFLGSIPALEAQTRLMFGKYMGFWVTPKTRK